MRLEVLLSVVNINKKDLDKMNIKSKCCVINQTDYIKYEKYKNFDIYSYNEKGLSKSRNRALTKAVGDIIIFCDDDVVYYDKYEKIILNEFKKNKNADIIIFNMESPYRKLKMNKQDKKLHFYNILRYSSPRIACRRRSIKNIKFNTCFGSGSRYSNGEEALFLQEALKNKLKIYASTKYICVASNKQSTWYEGYDEKYFFDKGAIFTALYKKMRYFLIIQYLLRHRELYTNLNIIKAFSEMKKGSDDYLKFINNG